MTPPTATTGASDAARYLWTQPYVAMRYFTMFFMPAGLSADNDWPLVSGPSDPRVAIGLLFVAALVIAIWRSLRLDSTKPIAYGLTWFAITLLPTSLTPLAEVANDHRMFFPFVGLSLAAAAAAALLLARVASSRSRFAIGAVCISIILLAESAAVYARNEVWQTEEALWRDVVEKSPKNGRGWMNYGLALMGRADYQGAADAFNTALPLTPNYHLLEINMGLAYEGLKQPAEAERHFLRAISLAPLDWRSHRFYAGWLIGAGRPADALAHARLARELNPADLAVTPIEQAVARVDGTAEYHLARSLAEYRIGRYRESIASAQRALALRPSYAEAWNNIAAGHNALREWDQGISACEEALRINPSLQIARNNLDYARRQLLNRK
jgi:tetratricopeptide (TPR) repeat protein